jgi:hypothetical protein
MYRSGEHRLDLSRSGPALLDPAAFETRIFRHHGRQETPFAFVAAPAFIWNSTIWNSTMGSETETRSAHRTTQGASYTVWGVYAVDSHTLELWRAANRLGPRIRGFTDLPSALTAAQRENQETAERYFADLGAGALADIGTWKACAVDMFRLRPAPGPQALAS